MLSAIARQDLKQLFVLTFPILITQICQSGLALVDTLLAGQVSALDLSGVAIGAGIWMPTFLLAVGILLATTPLIGEAIGQQRLQKVPFITQQSLWLALIIGIIGFVAVNQLHYLFDWMKVPKDIQHIAQKFLFGISFGFPAVCLYTSLRCYTESLKHPTVVMVISLIGLILNVPLSYAFIHGVTLGETVLIPAMGGAGCGFASGIALWINLLMLVSYLTLSPQSDFANQRFFANFAGIDFAQLR